MTPGSSSQAQTDQQDPGWVAKAGGWLFAWRTSVPFPIAIALLVIPSRNPPWSFLWPGLLLVTAGELTRLWSVRQIGVISRTRSDRLGPLVSTGPFAFVRNPLYLGNIALWTGFTLSAGLLWLAPVVVVLLGLFYHAIVRWEEGLLESRLGDSYRSYVTRVPRWVPWRISSTQPGHKTLFSWRNTVFSERGTLIAIAVGYALLSLKFVAVG